MSEVIRHSFEKLEILRAQQEVTYQGDNLLKEEHTLTMTETCLFSSVIIFKSNIVENDEELLNPQQSSKPST